MNWMTLGMKGEFALVIVFAPTGADGNQPRASSHRERRPGLKVTQLAFALKGQRTIDTFPVPLSGHQLLAPTHPGRRLLRALALGWFPLPPSGNAVKDFFSTIYKRMRKWEGEASQMKRFWISLQDSSSFCLFRFQSSM